MPLLNSKLSDALQTDFFTWFHLEESAPVRTLGERRFAEYKPSGSTLRELTTVNVTSDSQDRIQSLELVLSRSFIGDPVNGVYARDIAKSLLQSALTDADRDRFEDLINQIEFQLSTDRPVFMHASRQTPNLPEEPTPGYAVYLGRSGRWEDRLWEGAIVMENLVLGGVPVCSIFVGKR
jgi:hypothetical protein